MAGEAGRDFRGLLCRAHLCKQPFGPSPRRTHVTLLRIACRLWPTPYKTSVGHSRAEFATRHMYKPAWRPNPKPKPARRLETNLPSLLPGDLVVHGDLAQDVVLGARQPGLRPVLHTHTRTHTHTALSCMQPRSTTGGALHTPQWYHSTVWLHASCSCGAAG